MKQGLFSVTLFTIFSMTSVAFADLNQLVLNGQVTAEGGTRKASLHLLCNPDADGGAISIELWVPQAFSLKDFDYDDFEGPDAAARNHPHSLIGQGVTPELTFAAAGWYSGEEPDTFVFGFSQRSHQPGRLATWLKTIGATRKEVVWVQTAYDKSKRELRARFALEPATVKRIRDTIDVCLTSPPKPKAQPKQ